MTITMTIGADQQKLQEKLKEVRRQAEERLAQKEASDLGFPYIDLNPVPIQVDALALVSEEQAKAAQLATVLLRQNDVVLAALNPKSAPVQKVVESLKKDGHNALLFVCSFSSLQLAWNSYQYVVKEKTEITGRVSIEVGEIESARSAFSRLADVQGAIAAFNNPATSKIFEVVLAGALAIKASDIHLEPSETASRLRYRIDGELNDVATVNLKIYHSLTSRIKLLSGLKLNVKNEPQDGRFTIKAGPKDIEIRTSTIPSEYGETIVLRVLDPDAIQVGLEELGLRKEDLEIVRFGLRKPNGMILNTGPTGSGKTTTLYAFIRYIYDPGIKIITIEDPIEYHIEGISQTQVDPSAGYTFANGLRSILRQDPDVILVGEIRDLDTAEIAMHAALTGHVVFSTLHTNEAAGTIPRLVDMGAKPPIIAPALNLVIAQRLVRKLCVGCRLPHELTLALKKDLEKFLSALPERVEKPDISAIQIFEAGTGCDKCHGGYKRRVGVFEIFVMNPQFEELMHKGATEAAVKKLAVENGMVTMQQDGVLKVMAGITTFDEIEKATGPISFDKVI